MLALTDDPEADYIRVRMDVGQDAHPWEERYDGWSERDEYQKRR